MASVELRGLTKRYGDVAVVDDISLAIEHGHLVCLLGPSGCGKTNNCSSHSPTNDQSSSTNAWSAVRLRSLPRPKVCLNERNCSSIPQRNLYIALACCHGRLFPFNTLVTRYTLPRGP